MFRILPLHVIPAQRRRARKSPEDIPELTRADLTYTSWSRQIIEHERAQKENGTTQEKK